jgi:hypothetical protein
MNGFKHLNDPNSHANSAEPIHNWFGLTYSNYLVLPRALLQSMPKEWQRQFVALLEAADEIVARAGVASPEYRVSAVKGNRFIKDPIPSYDRGRTVIDLRPLCTECKRPWSPIPRSDATICTGCDIY